ncbi:MAG: hypothetical protein AAFZ87_01260 [Planctomycetota bacterium]
MRTLIHVSRLRAESAHARSFRAESSRAESSRAESSRAGVTLIELIFATTLAVIVLGAVLTVTQSALRLWTRAETVRDAREVATVGLGAIAADLRQLHPSAEGDLLVDWQPFDLERDGATERVWPRIRLVREVSGAERDAIERRAAAGRARDMRGSGRLPNGEPMPEELDEEELLMAQGVTASQASQGLLGLDRDVWGGALAEVLYAVVPEGSEGSNRHTGVLVRAERLHVPGTPLRFFGDGAFLRSGVPALELGAEELVSGVLWLEPLLATQTTDLVDGWRVRAGAETAATSWDAWRRARPDADVAGRNEPAPGMAPAGPRPLLPRSVRLSIEVVRPADRKRAPRLVDGAEAEATSLSVSSTKWLKGAVGRHVLVGGEWMLVRALSGDRVSVQRGRRDTRAAFHAADTRVLLGQRAVLDVPIALHDDEWISDGRSGGLR